MTLYSAFNYGSWYLAAATAAKSLQSCPTLCDPIDGSPLGSSVPGILQARILEWVAISFSNGWEWKVKVKLLSRIRLLATPWTAAYQAPPSMGLSRQEYWSGVPLPSPLGILLLLLKGMLFEQLTLTVLWQLDSPVPFVSWALIGTIVTPIIQLWKLRQTEWMTCPRSHS